MESDYDAELYDAVISKDQDTGLPKVGSLMYGKVTTTGDRKYYDDHKIQTAPVVSARSEGENFIVEVEGKLVYKVSKPKIY